MSKQTAQEREDILRKKYLSLGKKLTEIFGINPMPIPYNPKMAGIFEGKIYNFGIFQIRYEPESEKFTVSISAYGDKFLEQNQTGNIIIKSSFIFSFKV